MGTCPYCGNEVEAGKFICDSCSDSSSNPTVTVDPNFSLSSVPSSSLSEQIANESVLQLAEEAGLDETEYSHSPAFKSSTVESKFKGSRNESDSVGKGKPPEKVVSSIATKTEPAQTSVKPETAKKVETKRPRLESSKPVIEKTSLSKASKPTIQKTSLPKPSKPEIPKTSLPDSYQAGLPPSSKPQGSKQVLKESQSNAKVESRTNYTNAQRQYLKETAQNSLPPTKLDYTNAQRSFLADTLIEERLKDMGSRELAGIEIHSDFEVLNAGAEQNRTLYGFIAFAAIVFVFPFMTSGVIGFTFSVFLLAMIFGVAKAVINSLVNSDWNRYASWVYKNSKASNQEFEISFNSAYMIDRLTILETGEGDKIPLLGKDLRVRKHTRDLAAVQKLFKNYTYGQGKRGKLYVRDEDEPLVCIVEIDDLRFWCESI